MAFINGGQYKEINSWPPKEKGKLCRIKNPRKVIHPKVSETVESTIQHFHSLEGINSCQHHIRRSISLPIIEKKHRKEDEREERYYLNVFKKLHVVVVIL